MGLTSKGFYFSLDALLALMILSAVLGLIFRIYPIESMSATSQNQEVLLNGLKQPVGDMNSSFEHVEEKSVLTAIRDSYMEGDEDKARQISNQYLERIEGDYSLYLVNETEIELVYNSSSLGDQEEIRARTIYIPNRNTSKTLYNSVKLVAWN